MPDTVMVELPREVAERIARLARSDSYKAHKYINSHITPDIMRACEEALDNPTRSEIQINLCDGCNPLTPDELHALYSLTGRYPASDELIRNVRKKLSHTLMDLPEGAVSEQVKDDWNAAPTRSDEGLRLAAKGLVAAIEALHAISLAANGEPLGAIDVDQIEHEYNALIGALAESPDNPKCTCEGFNVQDLHEGDCPVVTSDPTERSGE